MWGVNTVLRCAVISLALVVSATSSQAADDCPPLKAIWLDLIATPKGYLVPVSVAGTSRYFLLDLGAAFSKIDKSVAEELSLPTKSIPPAVKISDSYGDFASYAIAPTLAFGDVPRKNMQLLIDPYGHHSDPRTSGTLAMNSLMPFDIELDLGANKLGLFLPKHCEGPDALVHWPNQGVGAAHIVVEELGTILLPMTLDGVKIEASIDTLSEVSWMSTSAAHILMGLNEEAANQIASPNSDTPGGLPAYPFKTLTADGVTISNPAIHFYRSPALCGGLSGRSMEEIRNQRCFGVADVALGFRALRHLHMFFSFGEKMVYFTAATPAPQ